MSFIKFKKTWEDDDSMLQLELAASNGRLTTIQDFYIYPDDLISFAQKLENFFPKQGKGEVVLEYGSEIENFYAYVLFKVTYRNLAELNIEIRTNNNYESKDPSENAKMAIAHFSCGIANQELNNLGKKLSNWSKNMEHEFIHEW
jgi:hypothetical protein